MITDWRDGLGGRVGFSWTERRGKGAGRVLASLPAAAVLEAIRGGRSS